MTLDDYRQSSRRPGFGGDNDKPQLCQRTISGQEHLRGDKGKLVRSRVCLLSKSGELNSAASS